MLSRADFLIPSIYFVIVGLLGTAFFTLKPEGKEVSFKVFAVYSVVTLLIFALIGLSGLSVIENATGFYMGLEAIFFVGGIIHALLLYRLNSWTDHDSFLNEFIFTLYIGILGAFAYTLVFLHFNHQGLGLVFSSAFIAFLVPFLFSKCFDYLVAIPAEIYPQWYFPVGQSEIEIPDEMMDDANIIVVEFRMTKNNTEDAEEIHSRSKLPVSMELGKFFPVFLDQYNDRNPGNKIEYIDESKQPYGWNFYLKPKWYQFATYLNPEITVRENGVKENDIIIAERV